MTWRYLRMSTYSWTTKIQERKGKGQLWGLQWGRFHGPSPHRAAIDMPCVSPYRLLVSKKDSDWWLPLDQSAMIRWAGPCDASLRVYLEVRQDVSPKERITGSLAFTSKGAQSHTLGCWNWNESLPSGWWVSGIKAATRLGLKQPWSLFIQSSISICSPQNSSSLKSMNVTLAQDPYCWAWLRACSIVGTCTSQSVLGSLIHLSLNLCILN